MLDSIDIAKQDTQNMNGHIENFVPGFIEWWHKAEKFPVPSHFVNAENIVIAGMGGSGQAGTIAKDLLNMTSSVPVELMKDYELPSFANRNTLVIAISYSGGTEETLNCFVEAYEKGCKLLAITTGGELAKLAEKYKSALFTHNYQSQPRAALHVHLAVLLNILNKLGHLKISQTDIDDIANLKDEIYKKWSISIPTGSNEVKKLAETINNKVPVIIGDGLLAGVAARIKSHFNENAKTPAYYEILPEMNHNALVGSEFPPLAKECLHLIMLDSNFTNEQNKSRMVLTENLFKDRRFGVTRYSYQTNNPLEEIIRAVSFGDYLSYYLAILYKVDPTAVDVINDFKKKLSK